MTLEEIENKITVYTAICINYGAYSLGDSAEKQIAYQVMGDNRDKLLKAIIEYGNEQAIAARKGCEIVSGVFKIDAGD